MSARIAQWLCIPLVVSLAGCAIATTGAPRAVPEVTSMLKFAAYPNGRLLSESGSSDNIGFINVPGKYGMRVYETADDRDTVRAYYEKLAADNHWTVEPQPSPPPPDMDPGGYPAYDYADIAYLSRDHYEIHVTPDYAASPAPNKFRFSVNAAVTGY